MRPALALALVVALAAAVPAQEKPPHPLDALAGKLRFRLLGDGRVQINPDPVHPDQPDRFTNVIRDDFMNVLANGGVALYCAIAYQGHTDLASMADAEFLLGKLGLTQRDRLLAPDGAQWARIDGEFDVERLRKGILEVAPKAALGSKADRILWSTPTQVLALEQTRATATPAGKSGEDTALTAQRIEAIVKAMGPPDATLTIWLSKDTEIPALPPQIAQLGVPERLSVWIPAAPRDHLRLQLVSRTAASAKAIHAQLKGLVRTAQQMLETNDSAEIDVIAEPALDVLENLKLHLDDRTISISVPVEGIDPEKLVRKFCAVHGGE